MAIPPLVGLSSAEVAERIRNGQVNHSVRSQWADYAAIATRHLFTLFNLMVVPAAVALFVLSEWQAGMAVSGMAIINTALGLFQEFRAKRHLDRLAILTETKAQVMRDGRLLQIPAREIVLGDCILVRAGDAILADGSVIDSQFMEVDEALLTGESDPVRRNPGEQLLSGSIVVAGTGAYRADKVGRDAFANSISAAARRYSYSSSPMTHVIDRIIAVLSIVAVCLCALYFVLRLLNLIDTDSLVLMIAATITSMVPQGLVLTATVAFTLGAMVMSRRGALVQRLNAVEAMAAIDVICTDKTGTLTTNRLRVDHIRNLALGLTDAEVRRRLALFATASVDRDNKSIQAVAAELGEAKSELLDQIPFKSKNRFSAVRIRDDMVERLLVLGAPEALDVQDEAIGAKVRELQGNGLRVLLFAESRSVAMGASFQADTVPTGLSPLAVIALADELRPEAGHVLQSLSAQGIAFKVISGDNPDTVWATVAQLNLPFSRGGRYRGRVRQVRRQSESGRTPWHFRAGGTASESRDHRCPACQGTPRRHDRRWGQRRPVDQKGRSGHRHGRGQSSRENRIQSGPRKQQLRHVAGNHRRRPHDRSRSRRAGKLFLVKNVYSLILITIYSFGMLGLPFPYLPQQVTLLNWLVIGIPAFIIALTRERSGSAAKSSFLREVGWFAVRTGVIFGMAGVVVMALAKHAWRYDEETQRTMLLTVLILLGITALLRVLVDGDDPRLAGDRRLRWLAGAAVPVYLGVMYWPISSRFFNLTALSGAQWLQVVLAAAPAYGLTWLSDRLKF